jgi:hypothetical protein
LANLTHTLIFCREGEDVYLRCAVEGRPEPNSLQFSKDVRKNTALKNSKNKLLSAVVDVDHKTVPR